MNYSQFMRIAVAWRKDRIQQSIDTAAARLRMDMLRGVPKDMLDYIEWR